MDIGRRSRYSPPNDFEKSHQSCISGSQIRTHYETCHTLFATSSIDSMHHVQQPTNNLHREVWLVPVRSRPPPPRSTSRRRYAVITKSPIFFNPTDNLLQPKQPKGRARKRMVYTRRFVNVTLTGGKRKVRSVNLYSQQKTPLTTSPSDEPQPRLIENQFVKYRDDKMND